MHPLDQTVWLSLTGEHRSLGRVHNGAARYEPSVSPFAALRDVSQDCLRDLAQIVSPGEVILIRGDVPALTPEWSQNNQLFSVQYVLPDDVPASLDPTLVRLGPEHVPAMLELTRLVLPGFFQPRSLEMGAFFGIFDGDQLVAMTGERVYPRPYKEITAVCTHPSYTGRGFASRLCGHVAAYMRAEGNSPFLHTAVDNGRARALYDRLGYVKRTETQIVGLRRS